MEQRESFSGASPPLMPCVFVVLLGGPPLSAAGLPQRPVSSALNHLPVARPGLIAFGKLNGNLASKPLDLPGLHRYRRSRLATRWVFFTGFLRRGVAKWGPGW